MKTQHIHGEYAGLGICPNCGEEEFLYRETNPEEVTLCLQCIRSVERSAPEKPGYPGNHRFLRSTEFQQTCKILDFAISRI